MPLIARPNHELCGQGNVFDPVRRRRTGRTPCRVLPLCRCNLWSGLERDRATAQCTFCDTDFVGTDGQNGGKFDTADALAEAIAALWPEQRLAPTPILCSPAANPACN